MTRGGKREGAGRKKSVSVALCDMYRDEIAKSNPTAFLINAYTTGVIESALDQKYLHTVRIDQIEKYHVLTYRDRCDIARDLLKKVMPDLKAVEHEGAVSLDGTLDGCITVKFVGKDANPKKETESE